MLLGLVSVSTWLYHILWPCVMVCAVSTLRHPSFGICYRLISRTVVLVVNSSSRALRLGSLCKPTHKRRLWELCLSSALQILDLTDWLIERSRAHPCYNDNYNQFKTAYLGQVVGRDKCKAVDANLMDAVDGLQNTTHPLETLQRTTDYCNALTLHHQASEDVNLTGSQHIAQPPATCHPIRNQWICVISGTEENAFYAEVLTSSTMKWNSCTVTSSSSSSSAAAAAAAAAARTNECSDTQTADSCHSRRLLLSPPPSERSEWRRQCVR